MTSLSLRDEASNKEDRPVVSGRQLEHYVFGSDTHLRDKQVAAKLRSMEFIPTTVVAEPKPPFPKAEEVAENLVRVTVDGELRWAEARPEEYVKRLLPFTRKSAGYYYAPKTAGVSPCMPRRLVRGSCSDSTPEPCTICIYHFLLGLARC